MNISLSVWSCHSYFYEKTMTNAEFIDFVKKETKATGVELLSVFWDKEIDVPAVQEALERTGLQVACFGACNNLAVPYEVNRKEQLKDILNSIDMAALLGAKVVRVFSGDKSAETTFEQAKVWIIEGLKEAASYAEKRGVTICLENHGYFAGKAEQVIEVINQVNSPMVRSTFDTGNFLLVDESPTKAMDQLKDRISHVHFKDFRQADDDDSGNVYKSLAGNRYAGAVAGEGSVDLRYMIEALQQSGYKGWLTVEYEGNEEQKSGSIRSINNLAALLPLQG